MSTPRSCPTALAILCVITLSAIGCASPPTAPAATYTLRPQATSYVRDEPIEYYLYLPQQYTPDRAWPLFVGLHGYGGSAFDCLKAWLLHADQSATCWFVSRSTIRMAAGNRM